MLCRGALTRCVAKPLVPASELRGDHRDAQYVYLQVRPRTQADATPTPLFQVVTLTAASGYAASVAFTAPRGLGTYVLRAYAASAQGTEFGSASTQVRRVALNFKNNVTVCVLIQRCVPVGRRTTGSSMRVHGHPCCRILLLDPRYQVRRLGACSWWHRSAQDPVIGILKY